MSEPVETEIKLAATPAMLERLRGMPQLSGGETTEMLATTYFDTADRCLNRAGISLRLRENGKDRVQTLKLPGAKAPIVERGEWTVPASGTAPKVKAFPSPARESLEAVLGEQPLERVAATEIARATRQVRHGSSRIELAFDRGTILAASNSEPVCELELELVDGDLADVLDLALRLPLGPELAWSVASKSERCLALADGKPPAPIHAPSSSVARSMSAADGFARIAWGCVSHLVANVPLVVATGDAPALHQARVAIRRLRAALGLFKPLFANDAEAAIHAAEFKAAAAALGPARDAQVLLTRLEKAAVPEGADPAELVEHVRARLAEHTATARAALADTPFQRLLLGFTLWLERGAWRGGDAAAKPLPRFAARALRKRRRAIRCMGDRPNMTASERHHLRIAIKKLRYGADFLAPLYADPKQARRQEIFAKRAAKAQDCLGELHDLDVLAADRTALFAGIDPIAAARLSAELDALVPALDGHHRALIDRSERALTRLDKVKAWWKDDL